MSADWRNRRQVGRAVLDPALRFADIADAASLAHLRSMPELARCSPGFATCPGSGLARPGSAGRCSTTGSALSTARRPTRSPPPTRTSWQLPASTASRSKPTTGACFVPGGTDVLCHGQASGRPAHGVMCSTAAPRSRARRSASSKRWQAAGLPSTQKRRIACGSPGSDATNARESSPSSTSRW